MGKTPWAKRVHGKKLADPLHFSPPASRMARLFTCTYRSDVTVGRLVSIAPGPHRSKLSQTALDVAVAGTRS